MKQKHLCKLVALTLASTALSLASAFAAPAPGTGGSLNLNSFLEQVEEKDPTLKAARVGTEGYTLLRDSGDLLTSPNFVASFGKVNNQEETASPAFQGNRTDSTNYSVGLAMNTAFGLNGRYTFNVQDTAISGVNPQLFPQPNFGVAYNKLELTQSLWKNGFGSQIRAQRDVIDAANRTQELKSRHQIQDRLVAAENAFWRLAFARRTVEIQQDVLARSSRALDWARRRTNLQLADRSDFLQAQASYDLNQLQLRSAEEEVRNAGRSFNLLRNQEGEVVAETLVIPTVKETVASKAPPKGRRWDILAAAQDQRRLEAEAQARNEDLKPTVDLVANLSWMGRDVTTSPAISESFTGKHPNTGLGVNLAIPLALGIVSRNSQGNELAKEASRLNLEGAVLNESLGWNELVSKLKDAQARLNLLSTIENVQKEKYENERARLLRGRTTTFQALQFETDYATTQLNTLKTQSEVLGLLAQMKLYQGEEQ